MSLKKSSVSQSLSGLIGIVLTIFSIVITPVFGMGGESIEIGQTIHSMPLKKQAPSESDKQDTSAYNKCYGRDMIFRVLSPSAQSSWRDVALKSMANLSDKLEDASIGQNPIVTSIHFKWFPNEDFNLRYTLPYLFFSGEKEKVSSRIYLTKQEAAVDGIPGYVKKRMDESNEEYALDAFVASCFPPNFFVCPYRKPIFVFPIIMISLN